MTAEETLIKMGFIKVLHYNKKIVEYKSKLQSLIFFRPWKDKKEIGFTPITYEREFVLFINEEILELALQWIKENKENYQKIFKKGSGKSDNFT